MEIFNVCGFIYFLEYKIFVMGQSKIKTADLKQNHVRRCCGNELVCFGFI